MGRPAGQEARVTADERRPLAPVKGVKPLAVATPVPVSAVRPAAPSVKPAAPSVKPAALPVKPAAPSVKPAPPVAAASAPPPAPAAKASLPPAAPSGVECKTVREILPPWEVLQEKLNKKSVVPPRNEVLNQDAQQALAAQEAANALWSPPASSERGSSRSASAAPSSPSYGQDSYDAPPSSGVRMSESGLAAAEHGHVAVPQDSLLSFKVYTVADLERRSDAPISMRSSRASFDLTSSRSSLHWQRALTALRAFATASLEWLKIKGERPSIKVALRQPFDNLGDELQVAVESIDWKKLGVTTGIVVGATLTILFAVLTAAELTDDLKPPGSAAHLASTESGSIPANPAKTASDARGVTPATNMAAMGVQPVAAVVAAPPAPEGSTIIGDVDAPAEAPAAAPAKKPTAKKAAPKPKSTKLALRAAPF